MAVTIVFAGTTDNQIESFNVSYPVARAGGGTIALGLVGSDFLSYGQWYDGSGYHNWESFIQFPYTPSGTDLAVSGFLTFTQRENNGANARSLQLYGFDWGTAVDAADYRPGGSALTFYAQIFNVQSWPVSAKGRMGNSAIRNLATASGPFKWVMASSRQWAGNPPTSTEYNKIYSTDAAGTTNDPILTFGTIRKNTLAYVLGAAKQLSDGTMVYIEASGAATPVYSLKYRQPNGTVGTIAATLDTTTANGWSIDRPSQQALALIVDAANNIYVVGPENDGVATSQDILARAWVKGAGLTWTIKNPLTATMPAYTNGGGINGMVGAFHPTTAGHLMVFGSSQVGQGDNGQVFWATLNCASLLAGSGTLVTASGSDPTWLLTATPTDYVMYTNETGSLMDSMADPLTPLQGFVSSTDVDNFINVGRYVLTTAGALSSGTALTNLTQFSPHDPQGKIRLVMSNTAFLISTNGSDVAVYSNTQSFIGRGFLDTVGITNFPTQAVLNASAAWDAVYDPATKSLWVYYLDTTDSRILRRTQFSLVSESAVGNSVIVSSAVGAVGSTNLAIRVPRGKVDERKVQVAVANLASGTLSTVYLDDSFNVAPNAPLLATIAPFDATQSKVFGWTFSDPNPLDTQSAYQLQIIRTSDSVVMLDTGKVVSTTQSHTVPAATLANAVAYQWKVKTWDPADVAGVFSTFQDFTTSGGGNVTITSPATDNPGGQITSDYVITWSTTGTTQASYRIQVIKTSDGSTFSDTGFITSTATTDTIKNLQTNTEYRVQVTVRNAALAVSNPGTRLITPVYLSPEVPVLTATPVDSYVQVAVTNPAPTGDNPDVTVNHLYRRLVGSATWTYLGDLPNGGTYRDYTAGANVPYEYYVNGEA